MKKVFFVFFLLATLFSCSSSAFLRKNLKTKNIRSKLIAPYKFLKFEHIEGFGSTISYKIIYPFKPSSIGSKNLIIKLSEYENIVDQHLDYKNLYDYKKSNQPTIFSLLFSNTNTKETIEQKNIDIKIIKDLTKNYEKWGPEWEDDADNYAGDISIKDIRIIRSEIRRIYGKL